MQKYFSPPLKILGMSINIYIDTLPWRSNKQLYGKSEVQITMDSFFVDLSKKLNSLSSRF